MAVCLAAAVFRALKARRERLRQFQDDAAPRDWSEPAIDGIKLTTAWRASGFEASGISTATSRDAPAAVDPDTPMSRRAPNGNTGNVTSIASLADAAVAVAQIRGIVELDHETAGRGPGSRPFGKCGIQRRDHLIRGRGRVGRSP